MAPPSIRRGKGLVDDPSSQRVKYLYSAAKAYESSLPIFAAHLGRQTLKSVSEAPKALSRECLHSLCPKCGYPWESSDKESFTLKPLTSEWQKGASTASRTGSVKPNAIRLTSCRLCGWTKTSRIHTDKLQVGAESDAGLAECMPTRSETEMGDAAELLAAELPGSDSRAVPVKSQHVEQVHVAGIADLDASFAGETRGTQFDRQGASTRPDATLGKAPLTKSLAPSLSGARDNPARAGEQPGVIKDNGQPLGTHQQQDRADETVFHEGLHGARPATAEQSSVSAPEACAGRSEDLAGAVQVEPPETDSYAIDNSGEDPKTVLRQGDIRSQVRHMMDASIPIALAMQKAVKQFEGNENNSVPRWPHINRKTKASDGTKKQRWLRVGRTWKKRAV